MLTLICRIASIIQSLEYATHAIKDVINVDHPDLTSSFMDRAREIANVIPDSAFVITENIFLMAKLFVEKCSISKLILTSYNIDPLASFEDAFNKIIFVHSKVPSTIHPRFLQLDKNLLTYMKKALTMPSTKMTSSLLLGGNYNKNFGKQIFNKLVEFGLGKFDSTKNCVFVRITYDELVNNIEIGRTITEMGVDLKETTKFLLEVKNMESEAQNLKRPRVVEAEDENMEPAAKKKKISNSSKNCVIKTRKDNNLPYEIRQTNQAHSSNQLPLTNATNLITIDGQENHEEDISESDSDASFIESSSGTNIRTQNESHSSKASSGSVINEVPTIIEPSQITIGPNEAQVNTISTQSINLSTLLEPNNQIENNTFGLNTNENNQNTTINGEMELTQNELHNDTEANENQSELIVEMVDSKPTYWKMVNGSKKRCSKNGKLLGAGSGPRKAATKNTNLTVAPAGIQTRRSSRELLEQANTQPPTQSNPTSSQAVILRNVSSIKHHNFNPLHHSTQQTDTDTDTPEIATAWDA
jgi:hypothetical protein